MKTLTVIAAAAAFVGGAGIANAADLGSYGSYKDAPASYGPGHSWAGLYIGGSAGFGVGDTSGQLKFGDRVDSVLDAINDEVGINLASLFSSDYDVNGAIYGAHVGYNFQRGNVVFGVEAGINGTDIDGSTDVLVLGKSERELDWYATATARLGYAADKLLFYGFGGVAWGTINTTLSVPLLNASVSGESDHVGWTAGLGVEYAMTERFSVRVEYSHVDFGEETASLNLGNGLSIDDEVDMTIDAIKIGASYKFGGSSHEPLK
jgi:outer membrane immunogenic protein